MEIKQIYELVNTVTDEVLGKSELLQEDLSNVIDVGEAVFNANAYDAYVKSLVNHIGKMVFVNRPYTGSAPSVLMDAWEFGSVLEKVSTGLPEATENESWELQDGASYDQNIFYKPKVEVKFFNKMTTFEVPMSFTERQVKQSFSNATQLNSFLSMLYTSVENSMTVKVDGLVMRTINNFTAHVYDYGLQTQSINLLDLYNEEATDEITTIEECLRNPEFIRFASYMIKLTAGRMMKMSTLFNSGSQPRFTPKELMHIILLEDFASAADIYLQSSTFHNELTALPLSERVPYWQGPGTGYNFNDVSSIKVKTAEGETEISGILGVIFDRYALGVNNYDRRVTSHYNAKAEFFSNWYKQDARYFNDFNENFVVFYVA